jgi:hypothetical protein
LVKAATTKLANQRLKMAGGGDAPWPRVLDAANPAPLTQRAPRARPQHHVHEARANAYPPSPPAPVHLHRLTANNTPAAAGYRCSPVEGDRRPAPPQTAPSLRYPRCGVPASRRNRDQHHRKPCRLPAACAAARPPVVRNRRPAPLQTHHVLSR